MARGQRLRRRDRRFAAADALPPSREVTVRAGDGTALHAEVFGPEDGYPIVLAHGIVCAIRVWAHQINELARDYRVIAYDHRGHGRSGMPSRRANYGLNFLAADLDAVLEATLRPGEKAVIAGHSMGGMAITSWSERYPLRVAQRADAVALINTTTGDLLRHIRIVPVPEPLSNIRVRTGRTLVKTFGAGPLLRAMDRPSRPFVSMMAVGRDADPEVVDFVYDLFVGTPAASRSSWIRKLVESVGTGRHIGLANLTVPTLVIGSEKDRLLPMVSSRHIARSAPNLAQFVELSGGHCAILERPDEVNQHLRWLVESVGANQRATS